MGACLLVTLLNGLCHAVASPDFCSHELLGPDHGDKRGQGQLIAWGCHELVIAQKVKRQGMF